MKAGYVLILFALASASHAFANDFPIVVPATLKDGDRPLVSLIDFPSVTDDFRLWVRCSATVARNGRLSSNVCFDAAGPNADIFRDRLRDMFIRCIERAVSLARVTPAVVDGKTREVWMNYAVEFSQLGSARAVAVHEYFPVDDVTEQQSFSGAQRVRSNSRTWGERCYLTQQGLFWIVADVDARGTVNDVRVIPENIDQSCRNALQHEITRSRFVPASDGGEFRRSPYLEAFFYASRRGPWHYYEMQ